MGHREYHQSEVERIQKLLDDLDPLRYPQDGPVRTILLQRVEQEKERAAAPSCSCGYCRTPWSKFCPVCDKYSVEYDPYFGRPRCLMKSCGWMPENLVPEEEWRQDTRG